MLPPSRFIILLGEHRDVSNNSWSGFLVQWVVYDQVGWGFSGRLPRFAEDFQRLYQFLFVDRPSPCNWWEYSKLPSSVFRLNSLGGWDPPRCECLVCPLLWSCLRTTVVLRCVLCPFKIEKDNPLHLLVNHPSIGPAEPEGSLQLHFLQNPSRPGGVSLLPLSQSSWYGYKVFLNWVLIASSLTAVQTSAVSSSETAPTRWSSDMSGVKYS